MDGQVNADNRLSQSRRVLVPKKNNLWTCQQAQQCDFHRQWPLFSCILVQKNAVLLWKHDWLVFNVPLTWIISTSCSKVITANVVVFACSCHTSPHISIRICNGWSPQGGDKIPNPLAKKTEGMLGQRCMTAQMEGKNMAVEERAKGGEAQSRRLRR